MNFLSCVLGLALWLPLGGLAFLAVHFLLGWGGVATALLAGALWHAGRAKDAARADGD